MKKSEFKYMEKNIQRKDIKMGHYHVCLIYDEDKYLNVYIADEKNKMIKQCGCQYMDNIAFSGLNVRFTTTKEDNHEHQ